MRESLKKHLNWGTVVGGVLITIITQFLIRISDTAYDFVVAFIFAISHHMENTTYSYAAKGNMDWVDVEIFTMVFLLASALFGVMLAIARLDFKQLKLDTVETTVATINKWRKLVKKVFSLIMIVFIVFLFVGFNVSYIRAIEVERLVSEFNQTIIILSPYISENSRLLLMSEWAQMSSKAHYLDVASKLDEIATQFNLRLPER